jgi:iron-sulfur cluster assembly accessory protein
MIDITENATRALLAVMARTDQPAAGLRIIAGPNGDSGLSYSLGLVSEGMPKDHVITTPRGITLFVAEDSLTHLIGATLDYQETESGHAFNFLNPNDCPSAQPKGCGCGTSSCST